MCREIFKEITNSKLRDVTTIYIVKHLELKDEELAFLTRVIHSTTFLVALKTIRIMARIENFEFYFYNYDALSGISQPKGEDTETIGEKIGEWVSETLEEYREENDQRY